MLTTSPSRIDRRRELDLFSSPVELTAALVDIASVSGEEKAIADVVETSLRRQCPHLEIVRDGNVVLARTHLNRPSRIILAGHLDTVPIADNHPSRIEDGRIYGCGTTDMKSGDAVFLHLAATIIEPKYDITLVFYDREEIDPVTNGLGNVAIHRRSWLDADLAILGEPTDGTVEAGCQGTIWFDIVVTGKRAHSARSWLGINAIHAATAIADRVAAYGNPEFDIDGCVFREGIQIVSVNGGVADNVVPDRCTMTVNYRFSPHRSLAEATRLAEELLSGPDTEVEARTAAPGALPRTGGDVATSLVDIVGGVRAKYGWTDVSRFAALGIPAVNYGPGHPNLAHTKEEYVEASSIESVASRLTCLIR